MGNLFPPLDKSLNPRKRIGATVFFLAGIFLILIGRLWSLQVINGEEYRELSAGNRIRLRRIKAPRGLILDRNHQVLVQNRPSFTVSIMPEDVRDLDRLLYILSRLIDKPIEQMRQIINSAHSLPFEPITLKSDLSFSEVTLLEEYRNELPGITVEVEAKRYYPYEGLAAHLLGYMGEINQSQLKQKQFKSVRQGDLIGQYGLERIANEYLIGSDGGKHVEVDAEGRELRTLGHLPPEPGHNIILTIDLDLQKKVEDILGQRSGAIVVMAPENGKILAMASHPAFNPNLFARRITQKEWNELLNNPKDPLQNRTIMAHYPPGSIFKLVVATAGMELGIIDKWSPFNCSGYVNYGNWTYYCWKKEGHGDIPLYEAIVHSCNCYFYQLASKIGIDTISNYAKKYGLGAPTGIILRGENPGLVPDSLWKKRTFNTSWYPGETITASIGQGYILVTPIQLACFTSIFANGGILYQPGIIESVENADGEVVKTLPPVPRARIPFKFETLKVLRESLKGVVNAKGTGWRAQIPEIEVAGKTGTAQVAKVQEKEEEYETGAEEKTPEHLRDHAWFVAFAPYEKPEITVVVLIEHGGHGGYTSAPLAKEVIQAYFKEGDRADD